MRMGLKDELLTELEKCMGSELRPFVVRMPPTPIAAGENVVIMVCGAAMWNQLIHGYIESRVRREAAALGLDLSVAELEAGVKKIVAPVR